MNFDTVKQDFPILYQEVYDKPIVYLDNAATTQKPTSVINAIRDYYLLDNANVHRGVHALSERATNAYEGARDKVKDFINAHSRKEIIFTRGTTESINLIANTFGKQTIQQDDEIIISHMEHHSNIVPWQLLCEKTGAKLKVIPINEKGELLLSEFEKLLNSRTKLVSVVHISNALGTINPIKKIVEISHAHNVPVIVDGAQAVGHTSVDVQALDCDFYAFSAHKLYGPTGIGVLYAKQTFLEKMPPYQAGGEMISRVSFEKTTFNELPHKFEAGTPNIAGVIGLAAAIDYINKIGLKDIAEHEQQLLHYATEVISAIDGLRIIGTAEHKSGIISFLFDNIHAHDVGTIVDREGIAIRAGHHCAMPLMEHLKIPATVRASLAFYNTRQDIDQLASALLKVREVFA